MSGAHLGKLMQNPGGAIIVMLQYTRMHMLRVFKSKRGNILLSYSNNLPANLGVCASGRVLI